MPKIWDTSSSVSRFKELESRLEHTEQQLRLLQKISRFMVRDIGLAESFNGVVELVVEFMECDSCLLYLLEGNELVLCASNNPQPDTIGKVRLKLGEGLTGWVARERRLLSISREAYTDPRFKLFTDLPEDTFEAFLSAPVIVKNRVAGVINVQHRQPHFHSGGEMELLTTVGEQVGCLAALAAADPARLHFGERDGTCWFPTRMMKTLLLSCLLILPACAQKWTIQYFYDELKSELEISDLAFPSADRGIAVGAIFEKASGKERYTSVITSDGGAHWARQPLKEYPRSIFFLNDSMGWMVTDRGLWFTEESGRTWKKLCEQLKPDKTLVPATTIGLLLRVWFLDEKHGFGVGLQKTIVETKDGGRTWTPARSAAKPAGNPAYTAYTHMFLPTPSGARSSEGRSHRAAMKAARCAARLGGPGARIETKASPNVDTVGANHRWRSDVGTTTAPLFGS